MDYSCSTNIHHERLYFVRSVGLIVLAKAKNNKWPICRIILDKYPIKKNSYKINEIKEVYIS
jgi:hypothetical protein